MIAIEGWETKKVDPDYARKVFQAAVKKYEARRVKRLRIALKICYGLLAVDLLVLLGGLLKWIWG